MWEGVTLVYLINAEKLSQCPCSKCSKIFCSLTLTRDMSNWYIFLKSIYLNIFCLNQSRKSLGFSFTCLSFSNTVAVRAAQLCEMWRQETDPWWKRTAELQLGFVFWVWNWRWSIHLLLNHVHSLRPTWSLWYAHVWEWWTEIPFRQYCSSKCLWLSPWKGRPMLFLHSSCLFLFSVRLSIRSWLWVCLAKHRNSGVCRSK